MMMNMHEMLMIMIWDVNACLTPWGVTLMFYNMKFKKLILLYVILIPLNYLTKTITFVMEKG
jgi:hypothetical protein